MWVWFESHILVVKVTTEHRMESLQKHWELQSLLFYSMADTEAPSLRTRLIQRALIQVQPLLSASGRTASWRNGLASQRTDVAPQVFRSPYFLEWQKSKFKRVLPMTSLALQSFLMGASFPQVQHIHIHLHRNLHQEVVRCLFQGYRVLICITNVGNFTVFWTVFDFNLLAGLVITVTNFWPVDFCTRDFHWYCSYDLQIWFPVINWDYLNIIKKDVSMDVAEIECWRDNIFFFFFLYAKTWAF